MKLWRSKLYLVGLGLGASLLLYQIATGYQALRTNPFTIQSTLFVALGGILSLIAYLFQMASWLSIMKGLGAALAWKEVTRGYLLSFLPRYIPGTVWGYLSRGEWLLQTHRIPYSTTNLGSLLEIMVAMLTGIVIIGSSSLISPDQAGNTFVVGLVILLPLLVWFLFHKISTWASQKTIFTTHLPLTPLKHLTIGQWLTSSFLFTIQWLIYGGIVYCLYQSFIPSPERFTSIRLLQFSASFSLAWIIGFLILFFPAGLGLRELVLTYLLSTGYSLSFSEASLISVSSRLLISLAEAALILVSLFLKRRKTRDSIPLRQDNPKELL